MGAFRIIRRLQDLLDVNPAGLADNDVPTWDAATQKFTMEAGGGGGGGAPTTADYLVGTADATLTNEIVVGATPGGELGNTWASPTVDTIHSGSSHAATQAAAEATAAAALNTHVTDPTDAHDGSAISNIPAGTIASTDVQAALNELDGQISTSLSDAVILAPASSARNVIQPTAGAVIAAIVKAHAAQSVSIFEIQDSAGLPMFSVSPTGAVLIETNTDFTTGLILKSNDPASNQQEMLQIKDSAGNTGFEVQNCGETIWRFLEPLQSAGLAVIDQVGIAGPLLSIASFAGGSFDFTNDGSFLINKTSAIASGSLPAAMFMPWLDPTNGAAKFMLKGKTLDGTVVTWELPDGVYSPGGGAPTTATYITQTPDAGLSAEQALSALATGLVKNTTGTGVLSIGAQGTDYYAPGGTDVAVADGGTGASTAPGALTNLGVSAFIQTFLDDASAAAARTTLGVSSPTYLYESVVLK